MDEKGRLSTFNGSYSKPLSFGIRTLRWSDPFGTLRWSDPFVILHAQADKGRDFNFLERTHPPTEPEIY